MAARVAYQYPGIPEPTQDPASLQQTVKALKACVEALTGQNPRTDGVDQRIFELKSVTGRNTAHILQVDEVHTSNEEALAQRTTTLEATVETNNTTVNARIDEVETTHASDNEARAADITTLQVNYGEISADGRVLFQTVATPTGATAAFGIFLRATAGGTPVEAGMSIVANSDGTAETVFTTNSFRIFDGSAAKTVFDYSGGYFVFTGDVRIHGSLIVDGSTNTAALAPNAITKVWAATSAGSSVSVTGTTAGGDVVVFCNYDGDNTAAYSGGAGTFTLTVDGTAIASFFNNYWVNGGGFYVPMSRTYIVSLALTAGSHTFELTDNRSGGMSIVVMELKR
jgi:hypothetical protein